MLLRLLFVLLIAFNIAVGAWLLLGQPYARGGNPSDPGVAELRLLSELPESAADTSSAAPAVDPMANAPPSSRSYSCLALGPFATQLDLRNARQALVAQVTRMRSRQEQASQASGWWVYLPATG
ncbi:MAG TPA: SPOR domain-containing protein, partial [Rhodanobacter sp.]